MFENFSCIIIIIIISDSDKLFLFWNNEICLLGTPTQFKLHSNIEKDWRMKDILTKTLVTIKQYIFVYSDFGRKEMKYLIHELACIHSPPKYCVVSAAAVVCMWLTLYLLQNRFRFTGECNHADAQIRSCQTAGTQFLITNQKFNITYKKCPGMTGTFDGGKCGDWL